MTCDHSHAHRASTPIVPDWLICPRCQSGALEPRDGGLSCRSCAADYPLENGFVSLLRDPGDRFHDEADCCTHENEEQSNALTTRSYYLPLWRKLQRDLPGQNGRKLRVLAAGCGVGVDVDLSFEDGVDAYGFDCGGRIAQWPHRRHPERLFIANAKSLPFATGTFDVVKTDCLLPHIGVDGDSTVVVGDYLEQRMSVARELTRIVRKGGLVIMGNPNRNCPVDLFHKGQMKAGSIVRFHPRTERFLLGFEDYRRLFVEGCGCTALETLPVAGYWNFPSGSKDPLKRHLVPLLRGYFSLLSLPGAGFLRKSWMNPWLMVAVTR